VQTAWDVADLGILVEKSFGGSTADFEQAKRKQRPPPKNAPSASSTV
jgi:hypothetical protein